MQIVLEQIEREKRDASDLVVSFFNDSSSMQARDRNLKGKEKRTKTLRSQKDVKCCKLQQSFETRDPH